VTSAVVLPSSQTSLRPCTSIASASSSPPLAESTILEGVRVGYQPTTQAAASGLYRARRSSRASNDVPAAQASSLPQLTSRTLAGGGAQAPMERLQDRKELRSLEFCTESPTRSPGFQQLRWPATIEQGEYQRTNESAASQRWKKQGARGSPRPPMNRLSSSDFL